MLITSSKTFIAHEKKCLHTRWIVSLYLYYLIFGRISFYIYVFRLIGCGCAHLCYATRLFQEEDDFPISDHMQDSEVQK